MTADEELREQLAEALLAHQPVHRGPSGPIVACLCGGVRWGDFFSQHQADALLPVVKRHAAEAWHDGYEAGVFAGAEDPGRADELADALAATDTEARRG